MYSSQILPGIPVPITATAMALPLAGNRVRAGFPSPAEDFRNERLDITNLLIEHPHSTYLLRVAGSSMREFGIDDGDLIVVDRALQARHGNIVVAMVESEFTVKQLHCMNSCVKLRAGNPAFPDITPQENETLEIWGVVTSCIKRFTR